MATKTAPLNLATAEQANGALAAAQSVTEICNAGAPKCRQSTFIEYQAFLRAMNLIELQDHAYACAVVPNQSARVMISRLEERFLRDHPEQRALVAAMRLAVASK